MKLALIGNGAIARYVIAQQQAHGYEVAALLVRPERAELPQPGAADSPKMTSAPEDLPADVDLVVDCAGHEALRQYGADILRSGNELITVSIGALADDVLRENLRQAEVAGRSCLHLASGAIGALDCLGSARIGRIDRVTYTGRKPPSGWMGSPAQDALDLAALTQGAHVHFKGSARNAALSYPKNANVAAAVALAGVGFDATEVELIADAGITSNIHEIQVSGEFGSFEFRIAGETLPGNPRTSALAAMSVVDKIADLSRLARLRNPAR